MSQRYGIVTQRDIIMFDWSVMNLLSTFPTGKLRLMEVGIAHCGTSREIMRQLRAAGREFEYFGLDIAKYPGVDEAIAEGLTYVQGDWPLTAPQMEDDSFHYVFIDGNHSFDRVVQDVEAFRSKVMKAGYFVFHDVTKKIIPPVPEYWQGYGERGDWKQHVAVRPALESLGLYNGTTEFRLVREDPGEETAGGVAVFQRI